MLGEAGKEEAARVLANSVSIADIYYVFVLRAFKILLGPMRCSAVEGVYHQPEDLRGIIRPHRMEGEN